MRGRRSALLRLLAVQGAWNYERMIGVGMGYASEPLLDDLASTAPDRHRAAVGRSAEFFNCHPYLAGLALGASARAEHDGVPGPQIQRLRTALCSPLGALGDQFFWAGLVPIVMSLALAALALGGGGMTLAIGVIGFNAARFLATRWALDTGLGAGMQVGAAISNSWLPRAARGVAAPAGFAAGLAIPLAGSWLLTGPGTEVIAWGAAALAAVFAFALHRWGGARWPSPRVGLLLAVLTLLWTRFAP